MVKNLEIVKEILTKTINDMKFILGPIIAFIIGDFILNIYSIGVLIQTLFTIIMLFLIVKQYKEKVIFKKFEFKNTLLLLFLYIFFKDISSIIYLLLSLSTLYGVNVIIVSLILIFLNIIILLINLFIFTFLVTDIKINEIKDYLSYILNLVKEKFLVIFIMFIIINILWIGISYLSFNTYYRFILKSIYEIFINMLYITVAYKLYYRKK